MIKTDAEKGNAMFTRQEGDALLQYIRGLLESELCRAPEPKAPEFPALERNGCCFVTLKDASGSLRGCIGHLEAFEKLRDNIERNTFSAAFDDPRFEPLEQWELEGLQIELSVLSPMKPIASLDEFVIGRDGIVLEKDSRRAVFLPQVAREEHWDKETTLNHLTNKAGLPLNAWRGADAKFLTFTAQVIAQGE